MKDFAYTNDQETFRVEYKTEHLDGQDNFTVHDIQFNSTQEGLELKDLVRFGLNYRRLPYTYAGFKKFATDNNLTLYEIDYGANDKATLNSATALSISTTTLPDGANGVAYDEQLVGAGGNEPYTFALDESSPDLQAGLTLNSDGSITGTPTVTGTVNAVFLITDAFGQTATATIALTVTA